MSDNTHHNLDPDVLRYRAAKALHRADDEATTTVTQPPESAERSYRSAAALAAYAETLLRIAAMRNAP